LSPLNDRPMDIEAPEQTNFDRKGPWRIGKFRGL
jgi:hypothetical protein